MFLTNCIPNLPTEIFLTVCQYMTDVWDFSSLLDGLSRGGPPSTSQNDTISELSAQMQQELDAISSQLNLLDSNPTAPPPPGLLITPAPRLISPRIAPETSARVSARSDCPSSARSRLPPLPDIVHRPYEPRDNGPIETRSKRPFRARPVAPPNQPIFKATPNALGVANFSLATKYVMHFSLQNLSTRSRGFRIQAPRDPAFSFRVIEDVTTSVISPGLRLNFEVFFEPTDPRDYEDSIVILAGDDVPPTEVSLRCYRDPPELALPDEVDLGETLVHSVKAAMFTITNHGGIAFFEVSSKNGREGSLTLVDGAFALRPSQFQLEPGESVDVEVKFRPIEKGEHSATFEIRARHFPQAFHVVAKGLAAGPELRFGMCDGQRLFVPFLPQDANQTKEIQILNEADIAYPFHVQIVRPKDGVECELGRLYPEFEMIEVKGGKSPFIVSPMSGTIGAKGDITLRVTFSPSLFAFYKANLVLFADRIPDATGRRGTRKMLTIAAEANAGSPSVSVEPPLVIFNDVVPRIPTKETVEVVNDSHVNVKLQWKESGAILPSPLVIDAAPKVRTPCELSFVFDGVVPALQPQKCGIFRFLPRVANTETGLFVNHIQKQDLSRPPSQHYTLPFSPLTDSRPVHQEMMEENEEEDTNADDEMPNIFKMGRICDSKVPTDNYVCQEELKLEGTPETQLSFAYSAHIASPFVKTEPPVLDFGYVLTGDTTTKILTLINPVTTPIGYSITFPDTGGWSIEPHEGIIEERVEIPVSLHFDHHLPLSSMITVHTFWIDTEGRKMNDLPTYICDVPVFAVFDRPFLSIEERILNVGQVFPTVKYTAPLKLTLLNCFPADFKFEDFESESNEYTHAVPSAGHLNQNDSVEVTVEACFSGLGKRALPFKCNVNGGTYTCAVCARVVPPQIRLVTASIDFSNDFVICNRSHSKVCVANDCVVKSTVRLEMIDDCGGVFSLDDTSTKEIVDFAEFAVSCYSEIHGDYYGRVMLIVEDQWQREEVVVPLHVKALGSFFGFQKHTLGYSEGVDGAFMSFGASIHQSLNKVIRRLTLENFSSEAITVEWTLENLVPGRNYASLDIDVELDGSVQVRIDETPEASLQDPFRILTERSVIESHGKTVVVIEFVPRDVGTFRGLVTARSGEFAHTLGLFANVV